MALSPLVSLPFKLVIVLAWFPITSSWNTTCHIRGLIHGIGRGVPNNWGGCASVEYDRITGEAVSVYM